jgi:hypothetical protein
MSAKGQERTGRMVVGFGGCAPRPAIRAALWLWPADMNDLGRDAVRQPVRYDELKSFNRWANG